MRISFSFVCLLLLARPPATWAQGPTLVGRLPTANALTATRGGPVELMFSEAMSAATATGVALKIFGGQRGGLLTRPGGAGGIFSGGGTATIRFQSAQAFAPGEALTVVLTTAATSGATGSALAAPLVWQFTAAAGEGSGVFVADSAVRLAASPQALAVGDVDGDGDADVLTANGLSATVSVRLNDGAGRFSGGSEVPLPIPSVGLVLADVDGDGDLDLLTAHPGPQGSGFVVSCCRNNGAGHFGAALVTVAQSGIGVLTLADIDGDGDLDLVTAPSVTGPAIAQLTINRNDGAGFFPDTTLVTTTFAVMGVVAADLDGDGDVDLLAPGYNAGVLSYQLAVLRNDGTGTFAPDPQALLISNRPALVKALDMDGDGDLDLLSSDGQQDLTLYQNDGFGSFVFSSAPLTGLPQLTDATPADVDGDGDLDLVVTDSASSQVEVLTNDGIGTWAAGLPVATGAQPGNVVAADLDGDFDLDLLTPSQTGTTVCVLRNGTRPLATLPGQAAATLRLTPNPATTSATLTGASPGPVTLLDALGRVVRTSNQEQETRNILDLRGLPAGLYVVRAGARAARLVVE